MNKMHLKFLCKEENDAFARTCVSSFIMPLDPTLEDLMEIKTIVSEAVVNAMIHGYEYDESKYISIECGYEKDLLTIIIGDEGKGIEDIELAKQPLYTTKEDLERSGMGLTIIENFADSLDIISAKDKGTQIVVQKQLNKNGINK